MRNQLCDWGDSGDSGGGVVGWGRLTLLCPWAALCQKTVDRLRLPTPLKARTPGRSRFSDSLSQEARTALGGAGQARIPAGIFQPSRLSRLRLAQPARGPAGWSPGSPAAASSSSAWDGHPALGQRNKGLVLPRSSPCRLALPGLVPLPPAGTN